MKKVKIDKKRVVENYSRSQIKWLSRNFPIGTLVSFFKLEYIKRQYSATMSEISSFGIVVDYRTKKDPTMTVYLSIMTKRGIMLVMPNAVKPLQKLYSKTR